MADMKMLSKLMEKKGKASMDPEYKKAKMGVLGSLHDEMGKLMGDEVKGLKKVTVAAPDQEGLDEGLEKAKQLISGDADGVEDKSDMEEKPEMEESEEASMDMMPKTAEEVDAKIQELLKLKEVMNKDKKEVRI